VEVHDHALGLSSAHLDLHDRNASDHGGEGLDVVGEWLRGLELLEYDPLLREIAAEVQRRIPHQLVHRFLLFQAYEFLSFRGVATSNGRYVHI
jgi:hypothetical protein